MNSPLICLAVDLGAGSGRVVAGVFTGDRLELVELTRFTNEPIKIGDGWHWNLGKLLQNIKAGITLATKRYGDSVVSLGVDTWGVDYGLLDDKGKLSSVPFQYRDTRTNGMQEKAFARMPAAEIYRRTGIQFMFFNTLFQLLAEKELDPHGQLLFMPDLVHYYLTGTAANEKTIASTSQLFDPRRQEWDYDLIRAMNLPPVIFGKLIDPGTILGDLLPEIAKEVGAKKLMVIAPAGHDTASAVVGVPAEESEPVFLSSGTWSIIGRELDAPIISVDSFNATFSNEGGAFGTTCFLKNVAGMWLLQECKRIWDSEGRSISFGELVAHAESSPPFQSLIDPDAADFQTPLSMPEAIIAFCRRTGQNPPETPGGFARVILESLALKYRMVKESLAGVTGKPVEKVYIVGGGSQNKLLNQFAADAMGCPIVAGPVEATSIGNILMQLYALGRLRSLAECRALVRRSFETNVFVPEETTRWDAAFMRFKTILAV
jgi:sugar (pentulose or hexulose) kinase